MMVSFVLSFFPRDVLDEILNLIESVSEDFPSYSTVFKSGVILTKFGHKLFLSLSAQPDYVWKRWEKKLLRRSALCIKICSDSITFY